MQIMGETSAKGKKLLGRNSLQRSSTVDSARNLNEFGQLASKAINMYDQSIPPLDANYEREIKHVLMQTLTKFNLAPWDEPPKFEDEGLD